jgi:uncharacterized protein (TIRG00374 family)
VIKWTVKLLLSLFLMTVLLWKTNIKVLAQHILSFPLHAIVLSSVLFVIVVGVRAYRWSAILSAYDIKLSLRRSFELIQVGNFFGQFLPMTVGGDMVRTWQAHRDGLPLRAAIHTVLLDRWFGFVSLLMIIL